MGEMENVEQGERQENADVPEDQVREGMGRRLAEHAPGKPGRHPEGGVRQGHPDGVGGGQEKRPAPGSPAAAS